MRSRSYTTLAVLVAVVLTGCNDDFFRQPFGTVPDTVSLYSLSRLEHVGLPSAFDFSSLTGPRMVTVEEPNMTGQWDLALLDHESGLSLAPAGYFAGITVTPALSRIENEVFADLGSAPGDEEVYNDSTPELAEVGDIFVVRTRQIRACVYYAKLEILEVDLAGGTLSFHYIANPNCNDRALIPPDD